MEQDSPAKNGTQPDESTTEITMAEVNALRLEEEPKKEVKLEELFADVDSDSDDEFPSTGRTTQSQVLPTSSPGLDSSSAPKSVISYPRTQDPIAQADTIHPVMAHRSKPAPATPRSCAVSTNVSSPGDIYSNGSIIAPHPPTTLVTENSPSHYKMMPTCGISLSKQRICTRSLSWFASNIKPLTPSQHPQQRSSPPALPF